MPYPCSCHGLCYASMVASCDYLGFGQYIEKGLD